MGASAVLVGLALAASVAGVAVLMVAVSRRWFARFRRGFLRSLMVALAGTGLAIAAVLGVWAYTEERDTILEQIVSVSRLSLSTGWSDSKGQPRVTTRGGPVSTAPTASVPAPP